MLYGFMSATIPCFTVKEKQHVSLLELHEFVASAGTFWSVQLSSVSLVVSCKQEPTGEHCAQYISRISALHLKVFVKRVSD